MPAFDRPGLAILAAVLYLLTTLGIGVWATRRTKTAEDFFVAGRGIGLLVMGLATMSAAFSGFVFLGGPGLTYRIGMASLFICVPVGLTAGMLCWTVGKRLCLLAEVRPLLTVPDALLARYRSRLVSGTAAAAVVFGSIGYLGAQLLAMGVLIESIFGTRALLGAWSLPAATGAGLLAVLLYAVGGGMLAGVYTDVFQGTLMLGAAGAVFAYALRATGGIESAARSIAGSDVFGPAFLDPIGTVPLVTAIGFFLVFSVGTLGQPHMLHKFLMLDDPRKLKWLPAVLGSAQSLCLLIWLGIGLAVPALVAQGRLAPLERPDDAAPAFLLGFVPELLAGTVLAGILAAIMSTADSLVNVAAAALVHDLPKAFGRTPRNALRRGRIAVLAVALAAAALALVYGDLIALLGTFAFGIFGAALAPALAVGLNWRRAGAAAATASILTGLGLSLGLELLARQTLWPRTGILAFLDLGTLPAALALAGSFAVFFVVAWLRPASVGLDDDVAAVMEI